MPRTDLTAPNGAKFHVGQTAAEIVALTQAARETDPGILVELGTWRAGATYVLRCACPSVPLFDTHAEMLKLVLAGPDAEARAVSVKLTRRRVLQRFTLARFFGRILKGCQEAAHAD